MVLPTLAFNFKIHFEAQDSSRSLEIVISRKCLIETRTFLLPPVYLKVIFVQMLQG